MFSCRSAAALISESLDHPLRRPQRFSLACHLAVCSACRAYRRQVAGLDAFARRYLTQAPPSAPLSDDALQPGERARLLHRIRQAQARPESAESP